MGWATPLLASATAAAAAAALPFDPAYDEGLGHSFCYVRLDKFVVPFSADDLVADAKAAAAAEEATTVSSGFESSESFAVVPLQPVPRLPSGPISKPFSGGFLSGPLDAALLSRPLPGAATSGRMGGAIPALRRSLSHGGRRLSGSWLTGRCSSRRSLWQQFRRSSVGAGEADEDRVHIVVSEELGWVFVGIYDGFNGPDATDFLVSHLYAAVHRELRGLLWEQREQEQQQDQRPDQPSSTPSTTTSDHQDQWSRCRRTCRSRPLRGSDRDQRRWKCEWECDYSSLKPPTQQPPRSNSENDHIAVLRWGKRKEGLGKSRAQQSGSGEDGRCRLRVLGFVWSVLRVMRFVCATYSVSNAVPIERSWGQTQRSSLRARRSVPLNVGARGGMAVGLHAQTEQ